MISGAGGAGCLDMFVCVFLAGLSSHISALHPVEWLQTPALEKETQPFGNSHRTHRLKLHSFSDIQRLSPVSTTRLTFLTEWLSAETELAGEGRFVTQHCFSCSETSPHEQGLRNKWGERSPSLYRAPWAGRLRAQLGHKPCLLSDS